MRLAVIACVVLALAAVAPAAEHEQLERDMKAMNKAYKTLLKQIKDKDKNADSLKLLADLQAATVRAKGGEPERLPKENRAEALADYRSMMATCLIAEAECERALLDGDNETAGKKLAELTATMEAGHKEYRPKKEKDD